MVADGRARSLGGVIVGEQNSVGDTTDVKPSGLTDDSRQSLTTAARGSCGNCGAACGRSSYCSSQAATAQPGANTTAAHRAAEARFAIWNGICFISQTPAISGTMHRRGPKNRPTNTP